NTKNAPNDGADFFKHVAEDADWIVEGTHPLETKSQPAPSLGGSRHLNMNECSEGGAAFSISIGLAFIGGYADASSYLLARTFTGHLTGNCVLAAVSAASKDLYLTLNRILAVVVFLGGILFSLILTRFAPPRLRQFSLAITMS